MATKLKSNKFLVTIISCLVLVGLSIAMYVTYPMIEQQIEEDNYNYFESDSFYNGMQYQMYITYFESLEEQELLTAETMYELPTKNLEEIYYQLLNNYGYSQYEYEYENEYSDDSDEANTEEEMIIYWNGTVSTTQNTEAVSESKQEQQTEVDFSQLTKEEQLTKIKELLNKAIESDLTDLKDDSWFENLYYVVRDNGTNQTYTYDGNYYKKPADLAVLLSSPTEDEMKRLKESYQYFVVINYDENGEMTVSNEYGVSFKSMYSGSDLSWVDAKQEIAQRLESNYPSLGKNVNFAPIKNMTYVYGVPKELAYNDRIMDNIEVNSYGYISEHCTFFGGIALVLLAGYTLIIPIQSFKSNKFLKVVFKLPIESLLLTGFASLFIFTCLAPEGVVMLLEENALILLPDVIRGIVLFIANITLWFAVFAWMFIFFLYIKNLFKQGWKVTFIDNCWTYRGCRSLSRKLRKFLKVDLKQENTKKLFFLVIAQFVLLSLFCLGWFFGIAGVFIYSIVLYVFLRKYLMKTQKDYAKLFKMTAELAEGNLDVQLDEDLGIFNAFKNEVTQIQGGFKKAVDDEVRSQKMKTDLIANVSHDLKTPLTSIITYTDLLKDDALDKEKRTQYLETLDQKAQRLKVLIEDLFEMSKASSGNITMNLQEVEVTSLMKQTLLELEDKIEAANLTIRSQFPDYKVMLHLDSERMFRVFDNLILNMTKYAMPGTRAYIDIVDTEHTVQIVFRNMSADEIHVNVDELTERFVRGDQARHTEGSGLGLAIAKSFVELQGGTFEISIDGDLFKVVITFIK